ncbi:MAG: hypothetical protein HQL50_06600 [Magnetococcales bacterium]|nr:hypothetical protein [Magnetococcales bacterium]
MLRAFFTPYTKFIIAITLPSLLLLTGCTSSQQSGLYSQSIGGGAVAGAAVGQMLGRDTKSTLIGAGIGALIGGLVARSIQVSQIKLAVEQQNMDQSLQLLQSKNRELDNKISSFQHRMQTVEQEVAYYRKKIRNSETTRRQTVLEIAQIKQEISEEKSVLEREYAELEELKQFARHHRQQEGIRDAQQKLRTLYSKLQTYEQQINRIT